MTPRTWDGSAAQRMPKRRRLARCRILVEEIDADAPLTHRSDAPDEVIHDGVFCDRCAAEDDAGPAAAQGEDLPPITGVRYTRLGMDYDLCHSCYTQLCDVEKRCYQALDRPAALDARDSNDESEESVDEDAIGDADATLAPEANGTRRSPSHGEMPIHAAQRTAVIRVAGALSAAEVKQLLTAHSLLRGTCGVLRTKSKSAGGHSVEGRGNWGTTYLHTDGNFARIFPHVRQKIFDLAATVDREQGWNLLTTAPSPPQLRCVELHTVGPGGSLPERTHYDHGSLITVDILLSNVSSDGGAKDFEGGDFCTLERGGELTHHTSFERGGDALVFVSHKYHCVQPVLSGQRQVLVAELWAGTERECAHRCEYHEGRCPVTLALSRSADASFLEYLSRFPHDPSNLLGRYPDGVMS